MPTDSKTGIYPTFLATAGAWLTLFHPPPLPAGTINCKLSRHSAAAADAEACIQKHPKFPGGWKCKAIAEKEGGNVSLIDCRGFSSALGLFTRYLRSSKLRAAMHNW